MELEHDDALRSAVLWSLSVIGEAAGRLTADLRASHADIEWPQIIGFRNFVVHRYQSVEPSILDVTARERVPFLRTRVMTVLASEYPIAAQALIEREPQD